MSFENWPVASFRQRSVYKTEFDIFKQNTDIDLISLLSYEEHTPKHFDQQTLDDRPRTVPESRSRYSTAGSVVNSERSGSRNSLLSASAYNSNGKTNKIRYQPERQFRRNTWKKGGTSVYKDFARTSRTLLRQKQNAAEPKRELKVNRECKSALQIRKCAVEPVTRSQTSRGFRPNEKQLLRAGKTNSHDVSKVSTTNKENKLSRQVNKNERSVINHIWRTKSAPVTANINNNHTSHESDRDNINKHINGRPHSGWGKYESDPNKIQKICTENQYISSVSSNKISCPNTTPAWSSAGNSNSEPENVTSVKSDEIQRVKEWQKEWENKACVENENVTCIVEKEEENSDIFIGNDKETCENSVITINEDGINSKDSGFASIAVTPELDFPTKRDFNEEKIKHVKFQISSRETKEDDEQAEQFSVNSENGDSEELSEAADTESKVSSTVYDINNLITDLERFGANSRLSVISAGGQSNYSVDGDTESLCGAAAQKALIDIRKAEEERAKLEEEKKEQNKPKDIESLNMSKEARHAIMETLKDMGTRKGKWKNTENDSFDMRHKSVTSQRRQTDNRNKYEYYMRERTKSVIRNQFKSVDSLGNEDNSSAYSSPREVKECDDTSSEEYIRGKLFPSIRESTKLSKTTMSTNKSNVMTLDHAKKTKYKIPGIGNYHLISSPDNDFEITPPGFDSRYNPRPIISKEEMEIPPRFIRERSIEKCKNWLTSVNLSPMSLRPAKRKK